jgi:hypothetical protein
MTYIVCAGPRVSAVNNMTPTCRDKEDVMVMEKVTYWSKETELLPREKLDQLQLQRFRKQMEYDRRILKHWMTFKTFLLP